MDRPVALVTGAARRVGRAVALALARTGHDIVLHFNHSADQAEQTAAEISDCGVRAIMVPGDFADPEVPAAVVEAATQAADRIDVLVNNAAVFEKMPLEEFDLERWQACLRINLAAPLRLCQLVAPVMRRGGGGCIVNFCDISVDHPWKDYLDYGCSKAGLEYATRALARALAPDIRVNGVAPGIAVFPEDYSQQFRDKLVDRVPLKREGTPEDMARTVCFLVESNYITGQIIKVDGGRSLG